MGQKETGPSASMRLPPGEYVTEGAEPLPTIPPPAALGEQGRAGLSLTRPEPGCVEFEVGPLLGSVVFITALLTDGTQSVNPGLTSGVAPSALLLPP